MSESKKVERLKQIQAINKLLKKQLVQKYGVLGLALLVMGSVAFFGVRANQASHAASVGVLSMSQNATSAVVGSNVTVTLTEDSGTDTINSVQAAVNYDATKLQYVSMAEGTAFPTVAASSTGTAGVIRVGRATPAGSSVTGVNNIVTITFKVLASSGTTSLSYDPAYSFLVRSTDNANTLTTTTGVSFALRLPAPTITAVAPATGLTTGGTVLTLTGTNFVSGATVSVGGTPATAITVGGATTLTATAPAHAAGAVTVVVTNPDGQTATRAAAFTYTAPAPTLTGLSPTSGSTVGGTTVTLNGTGFVAGSTVNFGGTAATSSTYVSPTQMTAVTPARAVGVTNVTVTTPAGVATTLTNGFTYVIPAPTVSTVTPALGISSGGTTITITGTNFAGITAVRVGGIAATSVTVVSTTQLTAVTPAHAVGLVDVAVTNTTGTATKTGAFTYRNPAPTVSAISPNLGTANGGTTVTITGTNFVQGSWVQIGGTDATNEQFVNSTTITATVPAHAAGLAAVAVFTPDGQNGSLASSFRFISLGDANSDGRVNAIDLSILLTHDSQNYPAADFNGDGTVGAADLAILLGRWTW